jgi:LysM repeat protein
MVCVLLLGLGIVTTYVSVKASQSVVVHDATLKEPSSGVDAQAESPILVRVEPEAVVDSAVAGPLVDEPTGQEGLAVAEPPEVGQGGTCISGYVIDTYHQAQGAGWTVRITPQNGSAQTKIVDGKGAFKFDKLAAGTYTVELEIHEGWRPFTPDTFNVTLSGSGTNCANVRMKLEALACLDVAKLDLQGRMGFSNMVGIPGWGMTVTSTAQSLSGYTNGQGRVRFTNLNPGVWTATEEFKVGWIPAPGYTNQQKITLIAPRIPGTCQSLNFVNMQIHGGCIQVQKVDAAGRALAGWKVILSRPDGTQASVSQLTNNQGMVTFSNLPLGQWKVQEDVKENWRAVGQSEALVDLNTPGHCTTVTFRNEALGCVAGYKINHLDQGLSGWTIVARNAAGEQYTTVTDKNGFFQFHQLNMGTWRISEVLQTGWEAVTPSEFDVVVTRPFVCEEVRFKNRTNFACVDVYKLDATDSVGLPGWQINIKPAYGGTMQTGTTDGTGHVRFNGLTPGTYVISETVQSGWLSVSAQKQTVTLSAGGVCTVVTFRNRQPNMPVQPAPGTGGCRYQHPVSWGDTLYSIARRYGTTVDAIKRANGITGNTIYAGRSLCIP